MKPSTLLFLAAGSMILSLACVVMWLATATISLNPGPNGGIQSPYSWLVWPAFLLFVVAGVAFREGWKQATFPRHLPGGRDCPQCGYDLRATPDRCPECGLEMKTDF